ncbi:MAG: diguanylate cyclase, partial [Thermoanaerobaculia bacterium]|nr:diguanylate cyclase [Thermoanaerobaculia bacterium]
MKLTSNSLTPRSVAGAAVLMLAVGAALPLVLRLIGGSVEMFVWAFVVVVLVLGLVVIRRIDRRLGSLTEVAEAIERGQVAPPTHDLDEGSIGDLSRAIRKMADRVHERINHDILTGLPNRRFFDALLEPAIREADERRRVLGVVLLDLDTFKDVNDGFGHEFGDDLLKQVAVRLVDSVRDTDAVARFGGDEFAVVVAGADSADAVMGSARRLVQAFREPFRVDGHELTVTASAGVGVYPKDGSTPLELVRSADAALYRAKNGGRNRLQICD